MLLRQVFYRRANGSIWTIIEVAQWTIRCWKKGTTMTHTIIRVLCSIRARNNHCNSSNNCNHSSFSSVRFVAGNIPGCIVYVDISYNAATRKREISVTSARKNFTDVTDWKNTCWLIIQTWFRFHVNSAKFFFFVLDQNNLTCVNHFWNCTSFPHIARRETLGKMFFFLIESIKKVDLIKLLIIKTLVNSANCRNLEIHVCVYIYIYIYIIYQQI